MRALSILFTLALAVAGVVRGAEERGLVVPREFVWIEFNTWHDQNGDGGNSIILAKRGDRVRLEGLGDAKRPPRWYEGLEELSPTEPGVRKKLAQSPLIFAQFERVAGTAPMRREVVMRGMPARLAMGRDKAGFSEAVWFERDTGHPLRLVLAGKNAFSWTEVYPVAVHVAERFLEPDLAGPSLREVYAEHIKQAKEQFDGVLRDQAWKKDMAAVQEPEAALVSEPKPAAAPTPTTAPSRAPTAAPAPAPK